MRDAHVERPKIAPSFITRGLKPRLPQGEIGSDRGCQRGVVSAKIRPHFSKTGKACQKTGKAWQKTGKAWHFSRGGSKSCGLAHKKSLTRVPLFIYAREGNPAAFRFDNLGTYRFNLGIRKKPE